MFACYEHFVGVEGREASHQIENFSYGDQHWGENSMEEHMKALHRNTSARLLLENSIHSVDIFPVSKQLFTSVSFSHPAFSPRPSCFSKRGPYNPQQPLHPLHFKPLQKCLPRACPWYHSQLKADRVDETRCPLIPICKPQILEAPLLCAIVRADICLEPGP